MYRCDAAAGPDSLRRSAPVIAAEISSCTAKMSVSSRSYRSLHTCPPSTAAISCAVTRIREPARRTLPSSTCATSSASAILRTSSALPRNAKDDVRAITFSPSTFASRLMISSARPSLKYSCSLSALRFANGRTAMDGLEVDEAAGRLTVRSSLTRPCAVWMRSPARFARQRSISAATAAGTCVPDNGLGESRRIDADSSACVRP